RAELERTLLGDIPEETAGTVPLWSGTFKLAVGMGIMVPLLALGYYYLSSYRGDAAEWMVKRERLDSLVAQVIQNPEILSSHKDVDLRDFTRVLQARLQQQGSQEPEGWYLLGVSYLEMQQLDAARTALARAYELAPTQPGIMLAYAQALIFTNEGRLDETSADLLHRLLTVEPHQQRALFLLGLGSFNSGAYEEAIRAWQSLLDLHGDSTSEGAKVLQNSIARAQALLAERNKTASSQEPAAPSGPRLAVTVELSPQLQQQFSSLSPSSTLFVFAKAADGPPMPLAAVRQPAKAFPVQVVLDDSQAVTPALKLSNFKQVVVGARLSREGAANAQAGDLQGTSATLELKEGEQTITLVIDQVVP
ncbi:MAG TPA: tetratricopeptide repeat protein, partial [Candidatus Competibacteraceae bacterium]|nr:tetratricopeptide repeat protein [Candidatus Competibacteraceae bacterium]